MDDGQSYSTLVKVLLSVHVSRSVPFDTPIWQVAEWVFLRGSLWDDGDSL